MDNKQFAETVDKLKGVFDVTNMISTFGEVALVTKKIQTHVKEPKVIRNSTDKIIFIFIK